MGKHYKSHILSKHYYPVKFEVVITNDSKRIYKRLEMYNDDSTLLGMCSQRDNHIIISINPWHYSFSLGTIVHECLHAILNLADYLGDSIVADYSEPYTYLIKYLFDSINEKVKLAVGNAS